jgi:peptide/nickel transport system ATP-binding protein
MSSEAADMTGVANDRAAAQRSVDDTAIVEVDNLTVTFGNGPGSVRAVENVSLAVQPADIYALVGESGCGKSTLAYALLDIIPPPGRVTDGEVRFKGTALTSLRRNELRSLLGREIAMVFQAAMNAFNPVITIGDQVEHILQAHPDVFPNPDEGRAYFEHLLELVRLPPSLIWDSFESQLSGGMKQRVSIALTLLLKPSVVVLDEPTTALDVLNQRLVIDILRRLHRDLGITIVFVTHDLAVVAELATRVAVMYAGRLVESGTVREIFKSEGRHPYVQALVEAIPSILDEGLLVRPIAGEVPNLAELPPGCRFAPRCQLAREICTRVEPPLLGDKQHLVACHVVNEALEVQVR